MLERIIETLLFKSRWLLTPLYLGLAISLVFLLLKFIQELWHIGPHLFSASSNQLILDILGLVDIVLIANLILMIIFSGFESFVSKIDSVSKHVDRPDWMGNIDYSALKLKVIGSIVAISSIELLRAFMQIKEAMGDPDHIMAIHYDGIFSPLGWLVIIHVVFVVSGVLFALMEKLAHKPPH
jgi:uncharacterized protein (TIGR00645 family)